ncbi:hypothetical protein Aperf_G00000093698 [Anoplocephala perfoliata]
MEEQKAVGARIFGGGGGGESALSPQSPCLRNPCHNGGECEETVDVPGGYQCICPEPFGGKDCDVENPVCKDEPCLNHGICQDLPNQQFRCSCPQEFSGLRCEFRNPCLVKPCKNGAECFRNNLGTRECRCLPGFTGDDCGIDINECVIGERSPCENNGTCFNEPGGYRCECLNGYTGAHCEALVLNCKPNPCQNGGVCEERGDHFECTCPRGYEGNRCQTDINDCKDSPCQNGGMCEDLIGEFRCTCLPGWKGRLCEERMLPCDSAPCLNNGTCSNTPNGSYVCQCPAGFNGTRCEVDIDDCVGVRCENGGHCVDSQNSWFCQCPPGFGGLYCEEHIPTAISAAYENGSVAYSSSFSEATSAAIPCKDGKSCLHDGRCLRSPTVVMSFCDCPIQWHGEFCEIPVCSEDACANDGQCREILIHPGNWSVPSKKESYCDCPPGYFGDHCLQKDCDLLRGHDQSVPPAVYRTIHTFSQANWCSPDHCQNGECVDLGGRGVRCHCHVGFGGNQCERRLRSCLEDPCLNEGICLMDPGNLLLQGSDRLFTCQCQPGFMDIREDEMDDPIVDPLASTTCGGHPPPPPPQPGDFCESQIPCYWLQCGPHGHCEADQCICNPGWGGERCNIPKSSRPQPPRRTLSCADSPCANHAQCLPLSPTELSASNGGHHFRCLCETALGNFTGQFCAEDIDECLKEPCLNGGGCENTPGSFICRCPEGFEGRFCEARGNPCDDTYGPVCVNGGICSTVNGKASCRCPQGFSGSHCEVEDNECAQRPCLNGGICVPFFGSYACRCPADFSGRHCERSLAFSPCSNQTCQNGGYCSGSNLMEDCHCSAGFYGRYCEVTLNLCHQLLEINLSTDIIDSGTGSLGHLLGNKQTLSLVAATSALLKDSPTSPTSLEMLNSLHLSKTALGPCYPPGTHQCLPRRISGDFECQCRHGFVGRYCEQRRDFCAEASQRFAGGGEVCLNGGQCINHLQGIENSFLNGSNNEEFFLCQCPPGFSGLRCELRTPSCDDVNICQNGGICAVEGSRLKCICPRGLGGTLCEVDLLNECEHGGNCLNGGKCFDGPGNYTCECLPNFCGARCELSGFACALEATTNPQKWPGEAAEARLCEMADCKRKAGNGQCDPECDRFACGFDAGECLYSSHRRPIISPKSEQGKRLSKALPWANCTVIHKNGIPCHLRFGDGKCDRECNSESCLFDGWDCRDEMSMQTSFRVRPKGRGRSKPVEGSLILLLGIAPSELLPENDEKPDIKDLFLDGLGALLRAKLRIRQQPKTGAPMVYPVPLAMVQKETTTVGVQRGAIWALTDTSGGVNVSVNRLIMDQDVQGYPLTDSVVKLSQVLAQLAGLVNKSKATENPLSRRRRESPETRVGSRVFLEFQEDTYQPMDGGSSFKNVETAAQFVTAALRTRRYTPPVDIFSVETATPEALQQIIADEEMMREIQHTTRGFQGFGLRGALIYCAIALICGLILLSLLGVLYRIVQRHAQAAGGESDYRDGQKGLTKMIKTTSIWYPRNSSARDARQGGSGANSGVFNCFSGLPGTEAPATMQSNQTLTHQNIRNVATPRSSSLRLWTREQALARGREKMALRASPYPIPPSGYSQVCAKTTVLDGSVMNAADVPSDTPLLMATAAQMPQVDVKAYFSSLMECLVSGNGVTEPFTEGFAQKLDYLRNVEMQQQQSEAASTMYRGGAGSSRKRTQTHSLLSQLLTSTLPETGETLLHLAARYNCANALSSLLNAGADPYAVDAQGSSVLLTAVNASAVDAARALLVSPQIAPDMPRLFVACPTEDKTTALIQAVKVSDIEMVELLLQTMASLIPDPAPLQMPSGPGGPLPGYPTSQMMQNRRLPGIDPRLSYPRLYPSTATTTTGNTTAGTMLMNPGNSGGDDGSGPSGLSTNSFGVNATDGEGRTALHWAALTEQPNMVQLLLRAGASHDVQTVHEETPLTFAAREGSVEICSLLLAAGANIEIADYLDRTPKQLAAANGHADVVQLLQVYSSAPQPSHHHHPQPQQSPSVIPVVQQQQQHRYAHRTVPYPDQSFFQPQQQQQQRYYRPPIVTTTAPAYSDGPSYEKHPKTEPPDYSVSGTGESFLMQLVPTTSSTCEGVVAATTSNEGCDAAQTNSTSKAYFFDQPPLPPMQQQFYSASDGLMTPVTTHSTSNFGGGGGAVNSSGKNNGNNLDPNWTVGQRVQAITNSSVPPTNGHTPSSDTESPAHWSSPSPTAISPPLAPPKMTLANSGQYQVSRALVSSNADQQVCCPSHGGCSTSTANNSSGGFSVASSDDCIKLEPRVF